MSKSTKPEIYRLFRLIVDERQTLRWRNRWRRDDCDPLTSEQYDATIAHLDTEIDRLTALYYGRPWPIIETHCEERP